MKHFVNESSDMGFSPELAPDGRRAHNEYQRARIWCEFGLTTALPIPEEVRISRTRASASQKHSSRCDPALIKAIARGRAFEELAIGRARSLQDLAKRDGISR